MEIDGDVEALASEASCQRQVVDEPPQAATLGRDDDVVEMWVATDDRLGGRLDDVGEMGIRIVAPQRPDERGGEGDVADQAQPDQQDLHGRGL